MRNKILVSSILACCIFPIHIYGESTAHSSKTAKNQQISNQPIVVNVIPAKKSDKETSDEKTKDNEDMAIKRITIYLTIVIALAAIVQAAFTYLQWNIYRHQLRITMPIVIVDWSNFIHMSPPPDDPDSRGQRPMIHHFQWGFRNVGDTPAFILETSARFVIVPSDQGIPKMKYEVAAIYVGEPLFKQSEVRVGDMPFYAKLEDARTYEEIEDSFRSGNETLYAFGYVRFRDRYGIKHISRFCLRYRAAKRMLHEYDGFGIAGTKQNQYR